MSPTEPLISFIFPVHNEQESLPALFAAMDVIRTKLSHAVELIFVDDGSTDHSGEILASLAHQHSFVKTITFSRNFGHQIACTAGLDHAAGDAVILMDADLQDPPEVALELIDAWKNGAHVVYAKRRTRPKEDGWLKKTTAYWYYRLLNAASDIPIPTDTGDFRLMDRRVVEELKKCREQNRYIRGLTSFVGFTQTAVFYDRAKRYAGVPKYKLFKQSLKLALDGLTGFSVQPLRIISYIGLVIALLSFLGASYVTLERIFFPQYTVSGFTIMVILLSFFNGVQMLTLGLVSEYIGRIYIEAKNRPLYVIKQRANFPAE